MALMQRDLVLRWLEQIRALVARLLRGDRDAQTELVDYHIDAALGQLLGSGSDLIERLEPGPAANLLADPFRIYGYAQLVALRGAVTAARRGEPRQVQALAERALLLAREAVGRADPVPPEWTEWVASLEGDLGARSE